MTPSKIRSLVAGYLKKPAGEFVVEDVDLIMEALNDARKELELEQDWELSRDQVTVSVNRTTGYTFDVEDANIKSLRDASIVGSDSSLRPIRILSKDGLNQRRREDCEEDFDSEERYRPDASPGTGDSSVQGIYQVGNKIFLWPLCTSETEDVSVQLDFYKWMPDYDGTEVDGEEDFFCKHGKSFLQWSAIVTCNMFAKEFVARQEGNVASPEQKVEQARQKLLAWNDFLLETGRVPELR